MRKPGLFFSGLLLFILLLVVGLALWGALSRHEAESSAVAQAREQARLAEIGREDTLGGFITFFWMAFLSLLLLGLAAAIFLLVYRALHAAKIKEILVVAEAATLLPNPEGNYPARLLPDGSLVTAGPGNLKPAVPYHYSPSLHNVYQLRGEKAGISSGTAQAELPPAPILANASVLPGPTDLAAVLDRFSPDPEAILLGLGPEGKLLTVPAASLCHVALGGRTGGGKDMVTRLLVGQLLAAGAHVFLADPHFTPVDPLTGEDWRMIEARLMQQPARKPGEIAALLQAFLEELDLRLEQRYRGERWGAPMFFVANEIPAIHGKLDLHQLLTRILREGRKVQMLMITSSQDWLVRSTGLDSGVRRQLSTRYYLGGDEHTGRALLELPRKEFEGLNLGKGLALLRSAATPAPILTRVPLATNQALYRLLPPVENGSDSPAGIEESSASVNTVQITAQPEPVVQNNSYRTGAEPNGRERKPVEVEPGEPPFSPLERAESESLGFELAGLQPETIRKLRERGMGKQAIIEALTPYTKGGGQGYRAASQLFDKINNFQLS